MNVGDFPKQVFIVDNTYPRILRIGVYRCLVTVQKMSLQNEERGICTLLYFEKEKIFIVSITIDESVFFESDKGKAKIDELAVHEFVHCAAALMSIGRIRSEWLIDEMVSNFEDSVFATNFSQWQQLREALGTKSDIMDFPLLSDRHFRTNYEDFQGYYDMLFLVLLMPPRKEFFDLFKQMNVANNNDMMYIIETFIEKVSKDRQIDKKYVKAVFQYHMEQILIAR